MGKVKANTSSDNENKNFFSKSYTYLENMYKRFSSWVSGIGIPLDKLNDYLDSKGIPSFALIGSILLVILLLIIFLLVFGLKGSMNVTFVIQDPNGVGLYGVDVTLKDQTSGASFSQTVNNGDILKLKLKIGRTYKITAIKDGQQNKYQDELINSKDQTIKIIFDEVIVPGTLKLKVLDSETNKIIANANAIARYTINGTEEEVSGIMDAYYNLTLGIPQNKNITLVVSADKYIDTTINNFQLNDDELTQEVKLSVSTALFEGKSKVTFIVVDKDNQPLSDATIKVFNLQGTLIDEAISANGKALLAINLKETITYTVSKEGYRTVTSDENKSYRILNDEETYTVTLPLGGTNLNVKVMSKEDLLPISDSVVTLYTVAGQKINSINSDFVGLASFTGLAVDSDVYVVACKSDYFCSNNLVSLKNVNEVEMKLEKITVDNSALLYVFVVDGKNLPLTNAKIRLYEIVNGTEVPYGEEFLADMQGGVSVPLKVDSQYLVYARVGDLNDFEYITISKTQENKLIFVINEASRLLTLDLFNQDGSRIIDGHITIKTKDGTILYDADVNADNVMFETKGYNDYIIDYTDVNGNKTTANMSLDEDNLLSLTIKPKTIGNYPIIEFSGILNDRGSKVNYISINKDYFLVFDVIFPEGSTSGGMHVRAGEDSETDSENMTFGITGYQSDSTRTRYSTTYTPEPVPGNQSMDVLNQGTEGEINKWIELDWSDKQSLSSKQVKIRVKAIELVNYKLKFKYRAWNVIDRSYFRDPIDATLGQTFSNSRRQGLYSETKELEINLFDIPLNCTDDLCVSYEFIDSNSIKYTRDEFFGITNEIYAVEVDLFSEKNREIIVDAETSTTLPIISFVSTNDSLIFPSGYGIENANEFKITKDKIVLEGGVRKKVYFFFVTKALGVSYINFKYSGGGIEPQSEKISFNIFDKRELRVVFNPDVVLPYGDPLKIEVYDSATGIPIENALITIDDDKGQFITSIKGSNVNGKNGKYTIINKFVVNKILVTISSHGYVPYTRELVVADDSILSGPSEIILNLGTEDISDAVTFKLKNTSDFVISNVSVGDVIWTDPVDTLTVDVRGPIGFAKKGEGEFIATAMVSKDSTFKVASGRIPIYGLFGNRQVSKIINVRVVRGLQVNDCLVIKPETIDTYVGLAEGAENNIPVLVQNNCDKTLIITPELKTLKSNSNNKLDIGLLQLTIFPGEETEYTINIINPDAKKQIKTYNYEIIWRNPYYTVKNTSLNVSLLDVSKALWVAPQVIYVPISQLNEQNPGITSSRFLIKNIGNVPITDIQLSKYPEIVSSNIGVTEYPREVSILLPNKEIPIDLKFQININARTIDDMYYTITGKAAGINTPITAKVNVYFIISSPNCIKVAPSKLDYTLNVGETKTRNITLTNACAEPIIIRGIDKSNNLYLETFGNNPLMLYPISGNYMGATIPVNGSATYAMRFTANTFGGSPLMPVNIIGQLATSGQYAKSEPVLLSITINSENKDELVDIEQSTTAEVPVCGKTDEVRTLTFPVVATTECTGNNGYCDAYLASELILKKIDELSKNVQSISAHYGNKVIQTGCTETAKRGFCAVSNLGNMKSPPMEFIFYLQNDVISPDLLREILSKSNYSFKNYMVESSPFDTMPSDVYGAYASGNTIMLSSGFRGCGRYKITIDGIIASDYENLYPDRAYYFVLIEDYKETTQCIKKVENFLNYLPWDRKLSKSKPVSTWLTVFTGDENVGKGVAKNIFNDELRYAKTTSLSSQNNKLDIRIGAVTENPDALAKIYYLDNTVAKDPKPETVQININDRYAIDNKTKLPENVITDATRVIGNFLSKQEVADICVNETGDSLLIMKLLAAGDLKFTPSNDTQMKITVNQSCVDYNLTSGISETIKVNYTAPPNLQVYFKYNETRYDNNLTLDLEKGKDTNFSVCFAPTVPEIYQFVGKTIVISAKSIYVSSGKLGHREAIAKINLTSCGVPPIEILKHAENTIAKMDKKPVDIPYTYYALIDWNKSYNTMDTETFCETLMKFNKEYPEAGLFFDYKKAGCKLDTQKAEKDARLTKAIKNSGVYGGACMLACGACVAGMDAIISWIPVFGQAKWAKDILIDCGIGCGIPAVSIFVNTSTNMSISEAIDKHLLGWLFGDDAHVVQGSVDWIGSLFNGIIGGVNDALTPGAAGVSALTSGGFDGKRMVTATPLGTSEELLYNGVIPTATITNVPPTTTVPLVTPAPTAVRTDVVFKGVGKNTLDEYARIITNYPNASYSYNPNYGYGTKPSLFASPTRYNELVNKFINSAGQADATFNMSAINNASSTDLDDLKKLVVDGEMMPKHTGLPQTYPRTRFSNAFGKYIDDVRLFEATGTVVPPVPPVAPTTPAATPAATPTNVVGVGEYDDMIKEMDTQIKKLSDSEKLIDDKIAKLKKGKRWMQFGGDKEKERLTANKEKIEVARKKLFDARETITKGAKIDRTAGAVALSDDAMKSVDDLKDIVTSGEKVALKVNPGAGRKWANFGAGLVKGIVCTVMGNMAGDYVLSDTGETGLSNSIVLAENITFYKNTLYMITLSENPDYNVPTGTEKSQASKRAMYMLTVEKYTGNTGIPDDARIDSCVIPGAPTLIGSGSTTPGSTSSTTSTASTKNFSGVLPTRSPYSDDYIKSKYLGKTEYQGECLKFARTVGANMFNYQKAWVQSPNAWTVANQNQSLGYYNLSSLNYDNLIPGSIFGIYIDGANQEHGLTQDQYSHVILYVGDFDNKKHVVMDGGWTNNNQVSFYTTIEEYFSAHPTYHLKEIILPNGTLDDSKKQDAISCITNKNEVCNYS